MSSQPKPLALYGISRMGGVTIGRRLLRIDRLGIWHKVIKIELIPKKGSIKVQGFKEANCFLRKTLEKKAQDLRF